MTYTRTVAVEFNHCDPAGIVFYPRYFEMLNSVVENFFREVVGYPFARMMAEGHGVPTVRIATDFRVPSRLGDRLDFALTIERAGRSSVAFAVDASAKGEVRMTARLTLVWVTDGRAAAWPPEIRQGFDRFMEGASDAQPA